ncbi:MAG: hypothetical protein KAS72_04890 [Phycisphaerales bacterium]|nr:hypothetical protein [Phycisphaerales bacterium]
MTQVDDLLRGRKTGPELLTEGRVELPLRLFLPAAVVLGALYGFFMGWYAILTNEHPGGWMQLIASTVKMPALFLLTLAVTLPSLYVFSALIGGRLGFSATLRLLIGAIVVNVTVAASLGPILGFFTVSTTSYPFMIALNVALLAIAGFVGMVFLLRTLRRAVAPLLAYGDPVVEERAQTEDGAGETDHTREIGPLERPTRPLPRRAHWQARAIFSVWFVLYGLVGAQMGWLLRPFVGSPDLEFSWLRQREGSFFLALLRHLSDLLGGG